MIYSSKPPFLFIHIPKTAGTSIEEALYQYQDFEINDNDIHVPAENYNEILKEFEIEKLTKRVSSLSINLNNIEMKIRELEYNLFNYEDGDEALLTQKNIIKEREIELVFKTKIWKIQKKIDRRKESYG